MDFTRYFSDPGSGEYATRARMGWYDIGGLLPDPDPVLRKLGQDIRVYRELLTDAHVWSAVQSRKAGTLAREWELREPDGGKHRANKKALDACNETMAVLDVRQANSDMLDAVLFGASPVEILWDRVDGLWMPIGAIGKPPEWFGFGSDNEPRFLAFDSALEGEPLPPYKFIIARHHASFQNPYGERCLSRCFWPVAFKRGSFKFWAIFSEKYGMPWPIGKVPRNATDAERQALLNNLFGMVQDAVVVINDDESIELQEAANKSASGEVYQGLISAANREISKAVLGQTLTTEIDQGGSYAASQTHFEVRQDLVDGDQAMVAAEWNRLIGWFVALNFPSAVPPVFCWYEEEDVKSDLAERDKTLTEQGVRFTRVYYERQYNLDAGDFELTSEQEPETEPPDDGKPKPDDKEEDSDGKEEDKEEDPDGEEFSEDFPPNVLDSVDPATDDAAAVAGEQLAELLAPVIEAIQNAKSLEEIGELLSGLYPTLGVDQFQETLTRAMVFAGLAGGAAVQEETSDD